MANIDRIVNVQILLRTAGLQQQQFSDLLLLGDHGGANRLDIITSADELLAAPFSGVTSTSPLYLAAQAAFSQEPGPERLFVGQRETGEAAAVALAALTAASPDWYGFVDVTHTDANIADYAAWAEANDKMFLAYSSDPDIMTAGTTEPVTALKTASYYRTAWWYGLAANDSPTMQYPEVAAAARAFQKAPGSETWANMRLNGVKSAALTEGQSAFVLGKNGNTYEPFRNISLTQGGKTAGGEYIDIIRGRDWLKEEIRVRCLTGMTDKRIPFTDHGIAQIRSYMIEALDAGVRIGLISEPTPDPNVANRIIPSYTTAVPARANISPNDVSSRVLKGVTFTARLAGAIHAIQIRGELTYENIG